MFIFCLSWLVFAENLIAQNTLQFFQQNRLYDALDALEKEKSGDYNFKKARIFHSLGDIENKLYQLGSIELKPYLQRIKSPPLNRKIGDKLKNLSDRISDFYTKKEYEKAINELRKFFNGLSKKNIANSVPECLRYYDHELYKMLAKINYNLAIIHYQESYKSSKKNEEILYIGDCFLELSVLEKDKGYERNAYEHFSKINPNDKDFITVAPKLWYLQRMMNMEIEAKESYSRFSKRYGNDPIFNSMLGMYMLKYENTKLQGRNLIEEAYKKVSGNNSGITRENTLILMNYGLLKHGDHNYKEALQPAIDRVREFYDVMQQRYGGISKPDYLIDYVRTYLFPRRFSDALQLAYKIQTYYPEAIPVYGLLKEITTIEGGS